MTPFRLQIIQNNPVRTGLDALHPFEAVDLDQTCLLTFISGKDFSMVGHTHIPLVDKIPGSRV